MIDAGHGGRDPGAVSRDGKYYEKNFTLELSKKLAEKISDYYPDVKVSLTRDTDEFVSLNDRAERANRTNAQLFMSIHVNASKSTAANGYSVHVLGESRQKDRDLFAYNMDVCRRENAVIMLEDDYSTKYQGFDPNDQESFIFAQLMQNAYLEQSLVMAQCVSDNLKNGPIPGDRGVWQDPFYVLWKTAMPAVLVEVGFISNTEDLNKLREKSDEIADRLMLSFVKYKKGYDLAIDHDSTLAQAAPAPSPKPEVKAEPTPAPKPVEETASNTSENTTETPVKEEIKEEYKVIYGVQIMAGHNLLIPTDKVFLGYEPEIVKVDDLYKYIIGVSDSPEKAKENYLEIKKKYSNCFIIKLENGVITPFR